MSKDPPSGACGDGGGFLVDAARTQSAREHVDEARFLGDRPLPEGRGGHDDPGHLVAGGPVALQHGHDCPECVVQSEERRYGFGDATQGGGELLGESLLAVEEYFAFVGKMPEVGALGDTGAFGDLRGCDGIEAALQEQLERGLLETGSRFLSTSRHLVRVPRSDSHCHYVVASVTVTTPGKGTVVQQIRYNQYGGPEVMRLEEVAVPVPERGQVRVRVHAAAANPADWAVRAGKLRFVSGRRFPRGMGHDFAGVVDAVGPGVTRVHVGDEVFGIQSIRAAGAFAEYLVTTEKNVFPKPATLSFDQVAALPMASVTAWSAVVDRAKVKPGQSVFITGCLGGVGRAAALIALMRGAEVSGNCSASGIEEARALGLREAFDYRTFDPAGYPHRFDAVIDPASALSLSQSSAMLKRGGTAVHVDFAPRTLVASLTSPRHAIAAGSPTPARMNGVANAARQGKLSPKIARTVPLAGAIEALTELETKGTPKGKLVIICAPGQASL